MMHKIKKIFVVDDEPDICLTLTNVLEDNGFVVHAFDNPFFALEKFRKDLYDVLILDIITPVVIAVNPTIHFSYSSGNRSSMFFDIGFSLIPWNRYISIYSIFFFIITKYE